MPIPRVFRTIAELPCQTEDLEKYPWLKQDLEKYPWLRQKMRVYLLDPTPHGSGAHYAAHLAQPAREDESLWPGAPKLIAKVPIVDPDDMHSYDETRDWLEAIARRARRELRHIRARLSDYPSANVAMDLGPITLGNEFDPTVTIQLFVDDAYALNDWLLKKEYRDKPAERIERRLVDNWKGIRERSIWVSTALRIAHALHELHKRRVTHSDIHPGNIMLPLSDGPITLIDLADAFIATPAKNWRAITHNPYLAPERLTVRSHLNERVDVYAFGILLLYLATGREKQITSENEPGRLRSHIHAEIAERNPLLLLNEPRIVDVIAKSIARDPVDRPRMADLCEDLESIAGLRDYSLKTPEAIGGAVSRAMATLGSHAGSRNTVLLRLLQKQVLELTEAVRDIETEMVEFQGTREQLLRTLISLFEYLRKGDSWSTVTTLGLWQRKALGSDGSYLAATVRALRREAAVRRTFLVSIQEVGRTFSESVYNKLIASDDQRLKRLGGYFEKAIEDFDDYSLRRRVVSKPSDEFQKWHRGRFIYLLNLIRSQIDQWGLKPLIARDEPISLMTSSGFYSGICPLGTLDAVSETREDNPASLMYMSGEETEEVRWLLVTTDAAGRCEDLQGREFPSLRGVRVFNSVMGKPHDRITLMEKVMNQKTVNVAASLVELHEIAQKAESEL